MASVRWSKTPSIFVDSSVLIAAAISATGSAREVLILGLRGEVTLSLSSLVIEETERNLLRKAPAAHPAFTIFRQVFTPSIVEPPEALVLKVAAVVAMKDAPIVAGALQARADYLVTFDRRHLIWEAEPIKAHFGLTVTTPRGLMDLA